MLRRRHRHHRLRGAGHGSQEFSSTSVFVTPMLDMSFQILAFFVFTYHPSNLEGQFPIALAAAEQAGDNKPKPETKASPQEATQVRPSVTVLAYATANGQLRRIEVTVGGKTERIDPPPDLGDETTERLLDRLRDKLLDLKQVFATEDRIIFRASPGLLWENSMAVMDACRRGKDKNGQAVPLFKNVEMDLLKD